MSYNLSESRGVMVKLDTRLHKDLDKPRTNFIKEKLWLSFRVIKFKLLFNVCNLKKGINLLSLGYMEFITIRNLI